MMTKKASSELVYRRFSSQNTRVDATVKKKPFFNNKLIWNKFALGLLPTNFIYC